MSAISPIPALFSTPGKIAVVTGGSRGLGLHAATGLLLSGCSKVYITSRKASACEEAVKALNSIKGIHGKAISVPADISKPEEITRFVQELQKDTDHVDILVANAGATWGAPYGSWKKEYWDKVMTLNVTSVFLLVQEMTPLLAKNATVTDPSRVITTSSVAGIKGFSTGQNATFSYSASKAAVMHLTKHLAVALAPQRILCNSIAPGFFPSKMANALIDIYGGLDHLAKKNLNGRVGIEDDFAALVVFLSAKASGHVNGVVIPLDGGGHLVGDIFGEEEGEAPKAKL
ncbi:hypothetical protein TWF173_010977 [Orbilia oligospora]|uniref:Rhamnolipids biosynthesis 3-oxoacyl-[acyl-carrier-protein] reductase n=2 Tax=Orbilia oligospora TaxID=2813651 RepID=G1XNG6_ARTOA|nr:hypothetical protein AOL_s00170g19 [Orbilia oligospora ATCC 24927]KAF3180020.1 hypothetical protein TWF751_011593 [Orbilia oligospora]EGX45312.1 hypothetical protein AOL_s00170g19 [Orbilia oligospora ATCC 24927]KAF3190963.1 hypothetical protein TWF225_001925 [Orbilia oligospora]KAF3262193.1 hypothetical protein TWF217_004263 [Orbilia oligospora]KAF3265320.1 hypothetical protein TWF128_000592 [Orbilia oligospora]